MIGSNYHNLKAPSCAEAVKAWYDERPLCKGYFSKATSHYTQVVWKSTHSVDCAISGRSPNGNMLKDSLIVVDDDFARSRIKVINCKSLINYHWFNYPD